MDLSPPTSLTLFLHARHIVIIAFIFVIESSSTSRLTIVLAAGTLAITLCSHCIATLFLLHQSLTITSFAL
jgi:hypothetical protein